MHKKRLSKRLHDAVLDDTNRQNRLKPWQSKATSKKHNLPEIQLQDSRITVIETRTNKQILTDPEEYNRDLNEKDKKELLKAII